MARSVVFDVASMSDGKAESAKPNYKSMAVALASVRNE